MLSVWPNPLQLVLHHDRAELRSRSRLLDAVSRAPSEGEAPWQAALQVFGQGLLSAPPRRRAVEVVLGCDLVRHTLLPWREEIHTRAEFRAFARLSFEQTYGSMVRDWAVVAAGGRHGEARLAAAVEQGLLDGMLRVAADTGRRVSSVRSTLAQVCWLRRRSLTEHFLLLFAEAGRACIALARDGRWAHISTFAGEDSDAALARSLARACLVLDLRVGAMPDLFVCAPRRTGLHLAPINATLPRVLAGI